MFLGKIPVSNKPSKLDGDDKTVAKLAGLALCVGGEKCTEVEFNKHSLPPFKITIAQNLIYKLILKLT